MRTQKEIPVTTTSHMGVKVCDHCGKEEPAPRFENGEHGEESPWYSLGYGAGYSYSLRLDACSYNCLARLAARTAVADAEKVPV